MRRALLIPLVLLSSSCLLAIDAGSNASCLASTGSACDAGADLSDAGTASGDGGLPAVMLLVDTSGSMNTPLMPTNPECGGCSGASCPQNCPTRASVLKGGMSQFLQAQLGSAWLGLTTFPDPDLNATFTPSGCAPATTQAVPLTTAPGDSAASVAAQSQAVLARVQAFGSREGPFTGGTPTAASLRFLATLSALAPSARPTGVILVTDGLPNCNPNNALSCTASPAHAQSLCTLGTNCVGPYCRAGYLDSDETVSAVRALRSAGVKVAVIGLGADFSSPVAAAVMNAVADEGGATACAPGVTCAKRYFEANNEAQLLGSLATALLRVSQ